MGSQLIKGYTIQKQSKGTVGAFGNWKLHDATKQGTNQPSSALIIQKKSLPKADKQQIMKNCKKQATALVKFKHPHIISITQSFLEDEHSMGFVVERVEGNLKLLLQNGKFVDHCSSELELKIHILELMEALNFLHNSVKMVHLGVNMNNIYITADGKWKLGGLVFSQNLTSFDSLYDCESKPNDFSYMAPEVAIQSKCSYSSDTFSLMVVALELLEHIKKPSRSLTSLINAKSKSEYQKHKQIFLRIEKHPFVSSSQTPNELGRLLTQTLAWDHNKRISLSQIQHCEWFTDNFIITIKHLSSLINMEQKMQLEFLKGLSAMVLQFDHSLIKKRIIPTLLELMKFEYLIAGILLTIIELMKKEVISVPEFQKSIWGPFKNLTQAKQISAHALYLFINNIEIFAKYVSLQDLNNTIVPLYVKCFDCPNKLKQLALRKASFLFKKLQYNFIKSKILPKILSLFVDKTPQIRKLALICILKSSSTYDSQVITDLIFPALDKLRKAGSDSFSNAITLQLYSVFSMNVSIQVIGNKIIPSLVPYLVDSSLSNADFEKYRNTIQNLMAEIQKERSKNPNMNEGQTYTLNDFEFPPQEKDKDIIKTNVQPNFDFLSMFKSQQNSTPEPTQQVQTQQRVPEISSMSLDFGNNFEFNAFSAPTQTVNNQTYTPPVVKQEQTNSYDYGVFSAAEMPTNFQMPATQQKSLDAAADEFFSFLEEKPKPKPQIKTQNNNVQMNSTTLSPPVQNNIHNNSQPNLTKPKYTLKGPPSTKSPTQVSPPKLSNISPPAPIPASFSQPVFTLNTGFKNEVDPFAQIEKQMNDFGDFSQAPPSNNFTFQPPPSNVNFSMNMNTFQPPAPTQVPQNNFNLNTNFLGTAPQTAPTPKNISKPPNTTKNINQISGDSFFDLL